MLLSIFKRARPDSLFCVIEVRNRFLINFIFENEHSSRQFDTINTK